MRLAVAAGLAAALACGAAAAQQVSPMVQRVGAAGDRFLVRLEVGNPYPDTRTFRLVAFDEDNRPADIWTNVPAFDLPPGGSRKVLASASFDGASERKMLICAETVTPSASGAVLHAQVCSKVSALRYASAAPS